MKRTDRCMKQLGLVSLSLDGFRSRCVPYSIKGGAFKLEVQVCIQSACVHTHTHTESELCSFITKRSYRFKPGIKPCVYFRTRGEGRRNTGLGWSRRMWLNIYSQNTERGFAYLSELESLERYGSDFKAVRDTKERYFGLYSLALTPILSLSSKRCPVEAVQTWVWFIYLF